jgi:hypothetical protein
VRLEFALKLDQNRKVGADGFALPLGSQPHHVPLLPLQVEPLIAMGGVVVNHNRLFNSNAIANFHSFFSRFFQDLHQAASIHRLKHFPIFAHPVPLQSSRKLIVGIRGRELIWIGHERGQLLGLGRLLEILLGLAQSHGVEVEPQRHTRHAQEGADRRQNQE